MKDKESDSEAGNGRAGIGRREVLAGGTAGASALLLGKEAQARNATGWPGALGPEQGFLSPRNPLATASQKMIEDKALALMEHPEMLRARHVVTTLWKHAVAWPSREQMDRFDNMIDEYLMHHAFRAANGDPNYPEVGWFMIPEHEWLGRKVTGSRWAGDSPDFLYRTIPIAHGGRYRIHGVQTSEIAPIVFYSLMADETASPVTLSLLESLDMDIGSDGSFTITVDATPPDGRRNHLQTKPGAEFLMIRDALGDWLTQSPNALTVERLNPDGGPKSADDMARHAARIAINGVYYAHYITQSGQGQPPNQVRPPVSSADWGGVATQVGTFGQLDLAPDQAIIVRSNAADANYRNLVLYDAFMLSNEYWKRTSSLNMHQMTPDEDGDFTYVISHQDPGIRNWLDTGGLRKTLFGQRWQAFTRGRQHEDPWMTMKVVEVDDLEREIPAGAARIDASGRMAQLQARQAGFDRRFEDS